MTRYHDFISTLHTSNTGIRVEILWRQARHNAQTLQPVKQQLTMG
jgi:hypothetical protein